MYTQPPGATRATVPEAVAPASYGHRGRTITKRGWTIGCGHSLLWPPEPQPPVPQEAFAGRGCVLSPQRKIA